MLVYFGLGIHGIQEVPQFCKCTFERHLFIMLPLPSHNLEYVLTLLKYASSVWGGIPKYLVEYLQRVKNRSLSPISIMKASLRKLKEHSDAASRCELERLLIDNNHPNYSLISMSTTNSLEW